MAQLKLKHSGEHGQFKWHSVAITDPGKVRKANEDNFMVNPQQQHFVVADGMGGHTKGDVASKAVCDCLFNFKKSQDLATIADQLEDTLMALNQQLQKLAVEAGDVVGSTVAGLIQVSNSAFLYWSGDSRIYRLRDGSLTQLSDDHTYLRELERANQYTQQQIDSNPERNMITLAVGVERDFAISNEFEFIEPNDVFVLCSDGIDKELTNPQLEQLLIVNITDVEQLDMAADTIMREVLDNGARDNATLILVGFSAELSDVSLLAE